MWRGLCRCLLRDNDGGTYNVKFEMSIMTHSCNNPSCSKPSHVPAKVEDLAIDELVKGM
jgi:hypothetical protein